MEVKVEDADIEWDVSGILNFERRRITLPNGVRRREAFYLVSWRGFPAEEDSWEPAANLDCPTLIREFWDRRRLLGLDGRSTRTPNNGAAVWAHWPEVARRTGGAPRRRPAGAPRDVAAVEAAEAMEAIEAVEAVEAAEAVEAVEAAEAAEAEAA